MTRCLIYAAKSTADERGSIQAQLDACRNHAASRGWEHDSQDTYHDEAASAYSGSRGPGLRSATARAAELAAQGQDVALLVFATDRLARGDGTNAAAHLVEYVLAGLKSGFRIESVTEDLGGSMALTLAALYGDRAHADSAAKSAHTKAGKRRAAERGRRNGGPRPFGYRHIPVIERGRPTSRLEVVPDEAAVIERIFREYLDGLPQSEIARGLNADGVRTVRGKRWNQSQVSAHLRNRIYAGEVRYHNEWFAGNHEPLVSSEIFAAVEALRTGRLRRGHGGGRPVLGQHLLTHGLLRCSCGASMRPRTERKTYGLWQAYMCSGRHTGETTCTRRAVARAPVDAAVWQYVEDVAVDHEAMVEDARRLTEVRIAEVDAQIAQAARELATATAAYERVRDDYAEGRIPAEAWIEMRSDLQSAREAADAASKRLHAHREALACEIDIATAEAAVMERIAEIRRALEGVAGSASSLALAREALRSVFEAFILHDDHDPPPLFDGDLASPREGWVIEPVPRADAILAPRVIGEVGGERELTQEEVLRQIRMASGGQRTDSRR
jgi:DNA invertase Pin-like site-specific DNA recombinase